MESTFVIVGGGIAGVTCVETLAFYNTEESILLISESALIKTVTNLFAITQALTQFDIAETESSTLSNKYPNVTVINDQLNEINTKSSTIILSSGIKVAYKFICLCMGATPKLIKQAENNPYILGIRDTDSVETFINKLKDVKKLTVVGNGGIASELVYKIDKADIDWVVKDKHITSTFVDAGAAEFFQSALIKTSTDSNSQSPSKRMRYAECKTVKQSGAALGPDWYKLLKVGGALQKTIQPTVNIHYECEIEDIVLKETCLDVILTNGKQFETELILSATGVTPKTNIIIDEIITIQENGYAVDEFMKTSIADIFAAGDVCTANWEYAKHWFPMKLWTQARQMGSYAAKCMSSALAKESILQDFCFEIFTHTTRLFGYKVILLGLYNGQKLGNDYEILLRVTRGVEYIKLVMQNNRLQGAVLIGDTDLEETFENLILNQLDLSDFKDDLLNPDIDIEDYFD